MLWSDERNTMRKRESMERGWVGSVQTYPVLTHQRDEIALQETQLIFPGAQIGKESPREGCVSPSAGTHPCTAATATRATAVARRWRRHRPRPWRCFRDLCENTSRGTINPAHFSRNLHVAREGIRNTGRVRVKGFPTRFPLSSALFAGIRRWRK